ncbi:hypothetical protein INR76_06155 [Marixanthomonas sp. SCSIO 43207]|uniref:hypothetical protein n=1 Tax=Marixanthomonas sp. SCSIO 43207 TaxID=2779360 RepID=UPI001CA7D877|nr:hypothetical protein [Marixanthomonas sp. SCSIO 43207]UAB82341.1 hypothetical protein INR76_06155 [Marixanthomonas sp. SCSIO 43207]
MKKKTILLLFLFFSLTSYSQIDSTKVSFVAYWSIGDDYDFKISKVKREWKNDVLTKKDSSQYIANFKVLDSTENSYDIKWTYKNNIVSTFQEKAEKLFDDKEAVNKILRKNDFSKVIYKTNELGEFIEILNWKELGESTKLLLQEMLDNFEKKNPEKVNELRNAMNPIIEIYSSKQGIEQLAINELQYFHFPFGLEYDITEPIEYEQELPNVLGGKPILADATLTFEEVDFENNFCSLKEQTIINPDDTKRVVKELFSRMKIEESKAKETIDNAIFDITDLNYYQYYYNPGVPHYIYGGRKFILKMEQTNIEKIEELYIELIYDE